VIENESRDRPAQKVIERDFFSEVAMRTFGDDAGEVLSLVQYEFPGRCRCATDIVGNLLDVRY
jgi:hypothetical protein